MRLLGSRSRRSRSLRPRSLASRSFASRTAALVAAIGASAVVLVGCGSTTSDDGAGTGQTGAGPGGQLAVVAAFAPLADIAASVGGDLVEVTSLTPPGVEPHDLELSAEQVIAIHDAALVVSIPGFQPAVDEAIAQQAADHALDATTGIELLEVGDEHEGEESNAHEHDHGAVDPHIWLDPANVSTIGQSIAAALAELDPANAARFQANADALTATMDEVAAEYRAALASCESMVLVTSHNAFGYLARAFGLTQVGISGLSPEAEPSPARLAEITELVREHRVTTIYAEALVDPRIAEVVAAETGAQVAVLDPIESLDDGVRIADVMRSNLDVLVEGQRCR